MITHITIPGPSELAPFAGVVEGLMPYFQGLMFLGGLITMGYGLFQLIGRDGSDAGGWFYIFCGLLAGGAGFGFPYLMGMLNIDEEPSPTSEPSPQPTTTSEPTRAPETVQEPADLTWLWAMLGIIVAAILVFLLVWLIISTSHRARRSIREAREAAEALRALQARRVATWQVFHDRHADLLRKILHAETDWDTLFSMPALSDPNVPQTLSMLRAMRTANTLRDTAGELPTNFTDDADLTKLPYPRAVEDFDLAWDAAERHARRVGQKNVPAAERSLIKQIRTLLDMAENTAASQNERNLAYKRAQSLMQDLESIHIPARAMEQLEERKLLQLTMSAETVGAPR